MGQCQRGSPLCGEETSWEWNKGKKRFFILVLFSVVCLEVTITVILVQSMILEEKHLKSQKEYFGPVTCFNYLFIHVDTGNHTGPPPVLLFNGFPFSRFQAQLITFPFRCYQIMDKSVTPEAV